MSRIPQAVGRTINTIKFNTQTIAILESPASARSARYFLVGNVLPTSLD